MKDKPHKWGFKCWVCAESTGYTSDFDIYVGKERSQHGLAYDVVMALVEPFAFQGYKAYCDNLYSSPSLFEGHFIKPFPIKH